MEIPPFPDARPLEITDKLLLDDVFNRMQPEISELTFAGLYLFRRAHDYRISRLGDSLIITGRGYDGEPYALPPLADDQLPALAALHDAGLAVYGADELLVGNVSKSSQWEVHEERNSFDYLYLREELATLPGNRFHKKKNRINYFAARHKYTVELFTEHHRAACHQLLDSWQRFAEPQESPSLNLELEATAEALCLSVDLGLEGVVVLADGVIKAFALGERLNQKTAVCHFEKADIFMEGLAQLVNREFSRLLFNDCTYINREQDLGEPGLRAAKLSYHPARLVKKFRLLPK